MADPNDPNEFWEFSRLDPSNSDALRQRWGDEVAKFYRLTFADGEGHTMVQAACLVKLGDRRFLDIFPSQLPADEEKAFFFQPVHTFFRVDSLGEQLVLRMTDDEEFKEMIQAEPNAVKHEIVDDRFILTAPTKDLQAFMTKYANDERLFPNDITLTRKAK